MAQCDPEAKLDKHFFQTGKHRYIGTLAMGV
jgi:hypothetical protein